MHNILFFAVLSFYHTKRKILYFYIKFKFKHRCAYLCVSFLYVEYNMHNAYQWQSDKTLKVELMLFTILVQKKKKWFNYYKMENGI